MTFFWNFPFKIFFGLIVTFLLGLEEQKQSSSNNNSSNENMQKTGRRFSSWFSAPTDNKTMERAETGSKERKSGDSEENRQRDSGNISEEDDISDLRKLLWG